MSGKTFVTVSFHDRQKAKACGAKWDPDEKSWYVEGNEELFQLRFTGMTQLERQRRDLFRAIDDIQSSIVHGRNEDIVIVHDLEREMRLMLEKEKLENEIQLLNEKIRKDHDVNYYIDKITKKQTHIKKKNHNIYLF